MRALQADKVYRDVRKLTEGTNYATAQYAALCSLEALACFLHGDNTPNLSGVTREVCKNENQSILEIGSGFGTITRLLLKLFQGPITCFELDENLIKKLKDFKKSLSVVDSERLIITNDLNESLKTKNLKFHGIIIDGPVLGKDLYNAIRSSTELRFVFIE
jgi:hypothetical protein